MGYTAHTWIKNENVTTEKLNNIEQSIYKNQIMTVRFNGQFFNKTWKEIHDAMENKIPVMIENFFVYKAYVATHSESPKKSGESGSVTYYILYGSGDSSTFQATTLYEDGYPFVNIK